MKKNKSNKNLYQLFSLVLVCICALSLCMCSNGGSKSKSLKAEQSTDSTVYLFLTYFTSSGSLIDSEYIEFDLKKHPQIPLNFLLRVTELDYDTVSNVKEAYTLRNLSYSRDYHTLFYGLSCQAGGNCEMFYISNFSLNGKVIINKETTLVRADMENVQDNYFKLVNDSVMKIKTIVSFYNDNFNYRG